MIRDRNTSIGLGSADLKSSKKFLREIRNQLEQNNRLKALFPDCFYGDPRREAPKWTEEEIIIKRDTSKPNAKEGTVKVFGLEDGLPTGDHYCHMVIDDAINEDNVRTAERIAKVDQQSRYLRPLLMTPDQPINWVGTRYHIFDIYQRFTDNPDNAVYIRQAIEGMDPIFPERFNSKTLEATRIELGSYIFSCQYMLTPTDPADKKFKREWLKWYTKEIDKRFGHVFFLVVDPASRMRKSSDFTAMLVFGLDHEMNFFLVDGVHDKLNPAQRIDAVFRLTKKWGIGTIGYETIGFQETDKFYIDQRQTKDRHYFEVVEITSHRTRKDERIMGLQPIMESGKFHLPELPIHYERLWESPDDGKGVTVDIVQEFLSEFDFFPNSAHDDLLDAAQMARHIVAAGHIPMMSVNFGESVDYGHYNMYKREDNEVNEWIA
jgi:phage terminase large subunit-like protein